MTTNKPEVNDITKRGYAVMTYARSGGTYLAQLLGSTGCLGRPEDWFNGVGYRNRGIADYPLNRDEQLAMVLSRGATPNGVFGVKLSPVRCDELRGFDWAGRLGPLAYIHLVRDDRLGQAISDVRAQQTGRYRSTTQPRGDARYDSAMIAASLENQLRDEARVRWFFALKGIVPLELSYEQLLVDEAAVLRRIAGRLSIDGVPVPDRAKIEIDVQRDEESAIWRERFVAEYAGGLAEMRSPGSAGRLKRVLRAIRNG